MPTFLERFLSDFGKISAFHLQVGRKSLKTRKAVESWPFPILIKAAGEASKIRLERDAQHSLTLEIKNFTEKLLSVGAPKVSLLMKLGCRARRIISTAETIEECWPQNFRTSSEFRFGRS